MVKFDKEGKYLGQMGDGEFRVPHSLALAEDLDTICVADRENRRSVEMTVIHSSEILVNSTIKGKHNSQ